MNLQQYRFKFLIISKNIAIAIFLIGFVLSVRSIIDFNKAHRVETMNTPEFQRFVSDYDYARASFRTLKSVAEKALDVIPQELDASKQATRAILDKKTNCLDCHNRLVFFDLTENDKLTSAGLKALYSSYELSPYGETEMMKWRLEVASRYWTDLDEELQKLSLTQITALSQIHNGRYWLGNFETDIDDIKSRIARLNN